MSPSRNTIKTFYFQKNIYKAYFWVNSIVIKSLKKVQYPSSIMKKCFVGFSHLFVDKIF